MCLKKSQFFSVKIRIGCKIIENNLLTPNIITQLDYHRKRLFMQKTTLCNLHNGFSLRHYYVIPALFS